jgi:hypothetical protein
MTEIANFRRFEANGRVLVVDSAFAEAALELDLLEPGGLEKVRAGAEAAGRGRSLTHTVPLQRCGELLHLRPLHHGGLAAGLCGRRLLGLARPIAELEVTARLRARGAPVAKPILVVGQRIRGFWRADLGTLHEQGSVDGEVFLRTAPGRARRLQAARAGGRAVRQLHDAGGRHADLHIGNLLVLEHESESETRVLVIDLDRAHVVAELTPARRMAELMRLYRSLLKRQLDHRVGPREYATFFGAYVAGDRSLRRALLTHLPREQRRIARHALLYRRRSQTA